MLRLLECNFLFFFTLSVLGWGMEVACKHVQYGRFINRGFLIGPYCPIYGFGSLLIVHLLNRFADSPLWLFCIGMVVCGTLEYITSYLMELLFHARWWDYSQKRFNINGRVCADTLVPFGLLGLLLVYVIQPLLFGLFARLPDVWMHVICAALLLAMLADAVTSASILAKIRASANLTGADDTETLTRLVREKLSGHSLLVRRALRAFPHMRLYNNSLLQKMRQAKQHMQREMEAAQQRLREDMEKYEDMLRQRRKKDKAR